MRLRRNSSEKSYQRVLRTRVFVNFVKMLPYVRRLHLPNHLTHCCLLKRKETS